MLRSLVIVLVLILTVARPSHAQLISSKSVGPWIVSDAEGFDRPHPEAATHVHSLLRLPQSDTSNVNVTNDPSWDQTEPSIAIDPTDPLTVVIGINNDFDWKALWFNTSHDGGKTWRDTVLPSQTLMVSSTDPSVVFDRGGAAYFLCGRSDGFGIPFPRNDVVCYRSSDHGDSWKITASVFSDSLAIGGADTLADKYYLAIDNSEGSPYAGRLYAAWVDQEDADTLTRIVIASSSDSGYHWTKRVYVTPDKSFYHSPVPVVGRDGEIYLSYIDLLRKQIDVAVSEDGGKTFRNAVVAGYRDLGPVEPNNNNRGYPVIKTNLAVNSFPAIAADVRPSSDGHAYIVWTAKGNDDRAHVFLSIGTARGTIWSSAKTIEDDSSLTPTDKFFPWIAVDQTTGHIGIDYYDSRLDPSNKLCDLFLSLSSDSGQTFTSRRVTTQSFDPTLGRDYRTVGSFDFKFFGDYIGLDARNGIWHPAWCDSRAGHDLEIYSAAIREDVNEVYPVTKSPIRIVVLLSEEVARLRIDGVGPAHLQLEIVDVLGRIAAHEEAQSLGTTMFRVDRMRDGPLFYRLSVDGDAGRTVRVGRIR